MKTMQPQTIRIIVLKMSYCFRKQRQINDNNFELKLFTARLQILQIIQILSRNIGRYSNWNLFQKVYQTLKVLLYNIHRQAFVPITRPSIWWQDLALISRYLLQIWKSEYNERFCTHDEIITSLGTCCCVYIYLYFRRQ